MNISWPILDSVILGNPLINYIESIAIFIIASICLHLLNSIILKRLNKRISTSERQWPKFSLAIAQEIVVPLLSLISFYFALKNLTLPQAVEKVTNHLFLILIVFQVTRLVAEISLKIFDELWNHKFGGHESSITTSTLLKVLKFLIWSVAIIFLLDNLGINVSAIIAGLGIGGVAVALAAQNILGDLFNYFVIFFDKPFAVGDMIVIGELRGEIEYVGIKTTRIRSIDGEQIIISNSDLTSTRIRNFKKMQKRRVRFSLGLTYQTPADKLQRVGQMIKEIISSKEDTEFDRAHFKEFGDSALTIEIVYFVLSSDYNRYMEIHQAVNLDIFKKFQEEKIDFAYPTRTVILENQGK
ncbi:MAG: mechanosensitive ion channel family protein [Proteobacteria bacterium]|nr:mechanosensitive ion channel family protein [Pseudomonadota bacterium]